jgi:hypothetical protein
MSEGRARRLSTLYLARAMGPGGCRQVAGAALVAWLAFCGPADIPVARAQDVIMYPTRGQAPEQQTQDRYECHLWAVQQSGFDPTQAAAPPPPSYAPPPPVTTSPLTGATRGAAIGAIGGAIGGNAGKGAAIGAATGALIGGIRRNEQRRQQQAYYEQQQVYQAQSGSSAAQRSTYARALRACLEGRGYTVG